VSTKARTSFERSNRLNREFLKHRLCVIESVIDEIDQPRRTDDDSFAISLGLPRRAGYGNFVYEQRRKRRYPLTPDFADRWQRAWPNQSPAERFRFKGE
jgi:hypothetical protein